MFYQINNLDKLENEMILIRKFLINRFLNMAKYNDDFYIYDYKIQFNEDIRIFNSCLNNFIDFFRTNYKDEKQMIKLYNYLVFIDYDSIYVKKNHKYTIKKMNHETNRKKQFPISYVEILENLINFEIIYNLKRFRIAFSDEYYDKNFLNDYSYDRFWNAKT